MSQTILEMKVKQGIEKVYLTEGRYNDGSLGLRLVSITDGYDEPFCNVTINLNYPNLPVDGAFVDILTLPELENFISQNHLGKKTEVSFQGYPLYQFDRYVLNELCN